MSGTWPTAQAPASVKLTSIAPTLVSVAHSLQRQVRSRGGQRWKLDLIYPTMLRADAAPILAFVAAQRGQYETFTITVPGYETPRGTWAGTPLVKGASQTGRSVALDGFTAGATVKAGDLVTFAADAKVYMVTADATADGLGELSLAIEPALVASPADNAAVTSSAVAMTCALASDSAEWSLSAGQQHAFGVSLVEVV